MLERDATKRFTDRVEIDDAYLGGERTGGKRGRGAPGKTPFVVAVETTAEGKPVRLKLRRVTSFVRRRSPASPSAASSRPLSSATAFVVRRRCRRRMHAPGCQGKSGPKAARKPAFRWANTALGNIKAGGRYCVLSRLWANEPHRLPSFKLRC
jgi:hypothetical protein